MMEFTGVMEKVLALTVWRREQSQNPSLTNREVTEREDQLRAQLPTNVALVYDDRWVAYGVFPFPSEAKQMPAMIECSIPNQRAVIALIAGGYICEQVGPSPFLYRTNAPLQEGVAFKTGGETLKLQGDKVFPRATERDRSW